MRAAVRRTLAAGAALAAVATSSGFVPAAAVSGTTGGAPAARTAVGAMPTWLRGNWVAVVSDATGYTGRYCSGIALAGGARELVPADCSMSRGPDDDQGFAGASGAFAGGGGGLVHRADVRYNPVTGQDDLAVRFASAGSGSPVLAGAGDSALYRPGRQAEFYSWTAPAPAPGQLVTQFTPHREAVQVRGAADCAALLGRPMAAGTLCTTPAPGAPAVPQQEQCVGDAGGALVTGGKLIGVSATPVDRCVVRGVRVYTSIAPHQALIRNWTAFVGPTEDLTQDGTFAAMASNGIISSFCVVPLSSCLAGGSGENGNAPGWANLILPAGDLNGDGQGDVLIRRQDGVLFADLDYRAGGQHTLDVARLHRIGGGWNGYTTILSPGDLDGDGSPDLMARDRAGVMWLYRGNGHGGYRSRVRISGGWNAYTLMSAHDDLNGDGIPDLVARDRAGVLWLYPGNGRGGFGARVRISAGWNAYNAIVVGGALDDLGRNELVARTRGGAFYLYVADGHGGFRSRVRVTGNWDLAHATLMA